MKPHALRRGLWLANLALGAAVLGLGAWYWLEVKPAVAKVVTRDPKDRPKDLEALRTEYEKARLSGLKWKPPIPVSDEELNSTILRADYKKKDPTHWVFSGPLPPTDIKRPTEGPAKPPPPQGLDVLGKIDQVIVNPPNSTIGFKFKGGKSRAFGVGDFVRLASSDPERFQITKILETRPARYEIHYAVYGDDREKPERIDMLVWDRSGGGKEWPGFLRPTGGSDEPAAVPAEPGTPTAGTTGDGMPGDATPGEGDGTGEGEATAEGEAAAEGETGPEVVEVITKRPEDLTVEDLKDGSEIIEVDSRRRIIKPKRNTYDYFKSRNAESVAQKVKTAVANDPTTGQPIGLRITGFTADAPMDVFDVRKGDILVSINGQKITSRAAAVRMAQSLKDVKVVTVVIDRRGKLVTYRVDAQDPRNRRKVRYFEGFGE